jgi:hypothetical protein
MCVKVEYNANSRFTIKSWKSQGANTKNCGNTQNSAKPKNQKQTQLRKTRHSGKKAWPKLDVKPL